MNQATRPRRRVNDRNIVLVVVGAGFVLAALGGLNWYLVQPGTTAGLNVAGTGFTFADLRDNAADLDAAVAHAFFDWLARLLLVLGTVVGIVANVPSPAADGLRVGAFLIGLLGAVATFYAVAQLFDAQRAAGGSSHGVLHNASFGFWACLLGFVLIMVAGAWGPRRS